MLVVVSKQFYYVLVKESQEAGSSPEEIAIILNRMKNRYNDDKCLNAYYYFNLIYRLDNPDVLSIDTVHQFLLCLRHQNCTKML